MLSEIRECQQAIGSKNYLDLLDTINEQEKIIIKQNKMITRLINETAEKENFINELMKDIVY